MQVYPHRYNVHAAAVREGSVILGSEGLPSLATAPPPQYGGPGGHWSPETLLVAAAADCFILTFRAIAKADKACLVTNSLKLEPALTMEVSCV